MFTVLVAEYGAHQEAGVSDILRKHLGHECTIQRAGNSREIFHFLENENTDIILLDMDMPGITCHDLTAFFQQSGGHCIVLPMAELDTFDHGNHPDEDAVLDYLLRPFSDSELILTLEEALELCRREIRRHHKLHANSSQQGEVTRIDIVRKKIHRYIAEHYSDIISMQDVAHAMNYSDTHFCRLFKQCFNVNFSVYLNDYRVGQAKRLLTSTNLTVKDVGFSCGYRDTSYFIRVFKRHTGMTPSDYRIHELTMTAKKSNKS